MGVPGIARPNSFLHWRSGVTSARVPKPKHRAACYSARNGTVKTNRIVADALTVASSVRAFSSFALALLNPAEATAVRFDGGPVRRGSPTRCSMPSYLQNSCDDANEAEFRGMSLASVDYSFYDDMPTEDVTECFLWGRLEPCLTYLTDADRTTVRRALQLAIHAHEGQMRKSGEPFVSHPVEVTRILAELQAERDMLVAGLLHDTVEDTDRVTLEGITQEFGQTPARIVEGETKFSKLGQIHPDMTKEELQALDLQQLFLAMTGDFRIIIVKLADRLHNMRTMGSMPPHKQKKIARETLRVFAPLANMLGLWRVKIELEDLSLRYSKPETFAVLKQHRDKQIEEQSVALCEAQQRLQDTLEAEVRGTGTQVQVKRLVTSLYSMYKRARADLAERLTGIPLEDVPDSQFVALCKLHRIIDEKTDIAKLNVVFSEGPCKDSDSEDEASGRTAESRLCYQILGIVHSLWAPVPGSMKDFISTPKRNGYRGLHSVMLTLGCQAALPVEVIIHTEPMHWLAEFGIAAESWVRASEDRCMQQSRKKGHHRAAVRAGLPLKGESKASQQRISSSNGAAVNGHAVRSSVPTAGSRPHNGAVASTGASTHQASTNGAHGAPDRESNGAQPQSEADPSRGKWLRYEDMPDVDNLVAKDNAAGGGVGSGRWEFALSLFASDPFSKTDDVSSGEDGVDDSAGAQPAPQGLVLPAARQLGDEAIARRVNWLQSIRHWQEEFLGSVSATEFVEVIQSDLLTQTVFAFTPAGDILRLPKGATVVDFAYHVHSEVGNNMVSAKVNGRMVGAQYELQNADVVEIIQYAATKSSAQNVQRHRDWLPLARTQSARHKLTRFLRSCEDPSDSEKSEAEGAASSQSTTAWLAIECEDRSGILADVATTISSFGGNIDEYSGGNVAQQHGTGYMTFRVTVPATEMESICKALRSVPAVTCLLVGLDK